MTFFEPISTPGGFPPSSHPNSNERATRDYPLDGRAQEIPEDGYISKIGEICIKIFVFNLKVLAFTCYASFQVGSAILKTGAKVVVKVSAAVIKTACAAIKIAFKAFLISFAILFSNPLSPLIILAIIMI